MLYISFLLLVGATLVASPIWGWFARKLFQRFTQRQKLLLVSVQFALICAAILISLTSWSLRGVVADVVAICLAYFSFIGLAFIASALKPKYLTWIFPVTAIFPSVAVFANWAGLLFALALIIADLIPEKTVDMDWQHSYRITSYGNATTTSRGVRVQVLHHPLLLPIVEKPIFDERLEDAEFNGDEVVVSSGPKAILVSCPKLGGETKVFSIPTS